MCPLKGGGRVFCPGCPGGGGGRGGLVLPRILFTCPGSQGTSCPCSLFMIRVEVPGSSFMLCLGPGPPSLLHLTRANAEKPYAGDTQLISKMAYIFTFTEFFSFDSDHVFFEYGSVSYKMPLYPDPGTGRNSNIQIQATIISPK